MGELKPCPFCSGADVKCFHVDSPERTRHWVLCRDCHASPGDRLTEAEAIAVWNTRPLETVNAGLLEAAKRVLAGLNARIDNAPKDAVPVFAGIADLHAAISLAEKSQ